MTTLITVPAGDTSYTLVAGIAGKIIIVRSIIAAGATSTLSMTIRLKSDTTVLTPWLRAAGTASFQYESQRGQIQTAAGESLKAENPLSDNAVVLVVYDVVNA